MHFYLSDKGNEYNEDFVFVTEEYGVLLDGATGLYKEKQTNGNTDAQVFSHELGRLLCENIANLSMSLKEVISFCLTEVHQKHFSNSQDLEAIHLPSATLSCFRKNQDKIEIACLGDSPVIVKHKDGLFVYQDEVLGRNEQHAIQALLVEWEKSNDFEKAKASIQPLLKEFRETKNTPKGYQVLDLSQKGLLNFEPIIYSVTEIEEILLISDGFYRLVDTFFLYQDRELLEGVKSYPESLLLLDYLRKLENMPNSLKKYPRLKLSDDASLVLWTNEQKEEVD